MIKHQSERVATYYTGRENMRLYSKSHTARNQVPAAHFMEQARKSCREANDVPHTLSRSKTCILSPIRFSTDCISSSSRLSMEASLVCTLCTVLSTAGLIEQKDERTDGRNMDTVHGYCTYYDSQRGHLEELAGQPTCRQRKTPLATCRRTRLDDTSGILRVHYQAGGRLHQGSRE